MLLLENPKRPEPCVVAVHPNELVVPLSGASDEVVVHRLARGWHPNRSREPTLSNILNPCRKTVGISTVPANLAGLEFVLQDLAIYPIPTLQSTYEHLLLVAGGPAHALVFDEVVAALPPSRVCRCSGGCGETSLPYSATPATEPPG